MVHAYRTPFAKNGSEIFRELCLFTLIIPWFWGHLRKRPFFGSLRWNLDPQRCFSGEVPRLRLFMDLYDLVRMWCRYTFNFLNTHTVIHTYIIYATSKHIQNSSNRTIWNRKLSGFKFSDSRCLDTVNSLQYVWVSSSWRRLKIDLPVMPGWDPLLLIPQPNWDL